MTMMREYIILRLFLSEAFEAFRGWRKIYKYKLKNRRIYSIVNI